MTPEEHDANPGHLSGVCSPLASPSRCRSESPAWARLRTPSGSRAIASTHGVGPARHSRRLHEQRRGEHALERPQQLAGKDPSTFTEADLARLAAERAAVAKQIAGGIGGAETGAGPTHWYDHLSAKGSRPWFISDPPDGRLPPMTPQAQRREAAVALLNNARDGEGRADSTDDRSMYDRCITRGLPGSMMPAIYGNAYQIVQAPDTIAIRYEMIHETRVIPLDGRPTSAQACASSWAMLAAVSTATPSWSRPPISRTARTSATTTTTTARSCGSSNGSRRSPRPAQLGSHGQRSRGLDASVDVRDDVDEGRQPSRVRVRLSRGQLRAQTYS